MLRRLRDLERYTVSATDGDVGSVTNFLLDDESWTVRYLVVDAGNWMGGRSVLISPLSFGEIEWSHHRFHVTLTKDKVLNSPSVDVDLPVSRRLEHDYHKYYGYPDYWTGGGIWGMGATPALLSASHAPSDSCVGPADDIHLRSANELHRYDAQGRDAAIGHIDGFILDDQTWEVRYLIIDTSKWWFGNYVLIAPHWASRVSWEYGTVYLDLTRDAVTHSPPWNGTDAINRDYEARLYNNYGHTPYWPLLEHRDT